MMIEGSTLTERSDAPAALTGQRSPTDETMTIARMLSSLLGDDVAGLRIEVYDGTDLGPPDAATTVRIVSPDFFHRVITGRGRELAFARAYVAGDVEVDGDIYGLLEVRERIGRINIDSALLGDVARLLEIEGVKDLTKLRPLPPPPEEVTVRGALHTRRRDARAISSHYDVSNDFYRLFLGSTMTYSCALFENESDELDDAQINKYDLICRKLGLEPGMRLLDIGCGWGGMVLHAAERYGVSAVGITISREQQELAEKRVADSGLGDRVEIRLQDYRDVADGPFDAVSSIGMFEHVGEKRLDAYLGQIKSLLVPEGRLLNHAINRSAASRRARIDPNGFIGRYVFPDGELLEAGQVVSALNRNGLEVRHVESLREHYALTLRHWVRRLEENWDEAVDLTSLGRARVWRLYMAVSALGFETNELNITQVLATNTTDGSAGLGLRPGW
jgi:cyclopropane-fatty-acyl-phospholipid synthase